MKRFFLLVILLTLIPFESAFALMPPWYQFAGRTKAALNANPCVKVGELQAPLENDQPFLLSIQVCEEMKAQALSTLLGDERTFGGTTVSIRLSGPFGLVSASSTQGLTLEDVDTLLMTALTGNHLFKYILKTTKPTALWVILKERVVQYYADNTSNRFGQNNEVAEAALFSVLNLAALWPVAVHTTSASRNPKNLP